MISHLRSCHIAGLIALSLSVSALAAPKADLSLGRPQGTDADLTLALTGERRAAALAHYSVALQLEAAGKSREALVHYREVINADPSNASLVAHTAEIAMNFGGRDEALTILRESIKANPSSPQPYLSLARFLSTYAPDDPFEKDNAANAIAEALKRFPQNAAVYRDAVMLYLTSGTSRPQAAKVLDQALKQPVADPSFWLAVGRVAQEVWPLGQQESRQENRDRVNPFFEKALQSAGASGTDAKLQVAQYYLLSNQLPQAKTLCEKLVSENENAQARKLLFRLYETEGKKDLALQTLEAIVRQEPGDVEYRKNLANAYIQKFDDSRTTALLSEAELLQLLEKSAAQLESAIQLGGGGAEDYARLSRLLLISRLTEKSLQVSQRGAQLFPEVPLFRTNIALALMATKQYDRAIPHFEEAERLGESGSVGAFEDPARFYFQFGVAFERLGRYLEAEKRFEKSISLSSKDDLKDAANTMNYLGYMWLDQGRNLDKAGELIGKANELEPNNAAFIDSLGWLHFKKGDYKSALTELLRARELLKELEPEDAEIVDHIGQAYQKLGDKEKAVENLRKAHELDPANEKIKERLDEALGRPKQEPKPKTEEAPPEAKPGKK